MDKITFIKESSPRCFKSFEKTFVNIYSKIILFLNHKVIRSRIYAWADSIQIKDKKRIADECVSFYDSRGVSVGEYIDFRFDLQSDDFKQTFLSLNEQRECLNYLNPIMYYTLSRNKFMAHKMMEQTGIAKSMCYCFYHPEAKYFDSGDCASSLHDVLRILKSKNVDTCVIKTAESSHGSNVWVIKYIDYTADDAALTCHDDEKVLLSSIINMQEQLVFESVVRQTKQFSAFNASSVNTVRFMTTLFPDGSAKIIATFIKIGRAGRCVDNAGGGGNVDVCIDVESGELKYAIQFDGWDKIKEIEKHPDSGTQLNGVVIDNWNAIKAKVIEFQQAFPYCKAAGWDIAITDNGPVVIEVNDYWDRTGQYFIRRGWRNEILECYQAWKKTGAVYRVNR